LPLTAMLEDASNQKLLALWRTGDERAAQVLVQRYMVRLTALARSRISRKLARRLDPEDVVLSAWRSFFVATGAGKLVAPDDDDLWPLLVTLTLRKLARQSARQGAKRRDVQTEESLDSVREWQAAVSRDPSPEEAAILADEVEALMASLDDADREVLTRRLQGDDQATIAAAMNCSERTVRRSMQRARDALTKSRDIAIDHPQDEAAAEGEVAAERLARCAATSSGRLDLDSGLPEPNIPYTDIVLKELIGQGGFGKVYRAKRTFDGAIVAVKYLKKQFWKDQRASRLFVDETTTVAALSHPHIIRHYGCGRSPHGGVFVVMEWIDGGDARKWVAESHPTVTNILDCGIAVASALTAAHAAGIVHGDVTPGNVLRGRDGSFVLTDFGFAHSLHGTPRTHRGGTPGFLAPEQVTDAFGPVTERTDIYGIGGLIYALLTGRAPTGGSDTPEILANVLSSRPPTAASEIVAGVPTAVDRLLLRCLAKLPADRPPSVSEVSKRLEALASNLRVG
jgi:RNA polymerase sigma factor (sigma-70 family)